MIKYPNLKLRSKNELIKRLTGKDYKKEKEREKTSNLLGECIKDFDSFWRDNTSKSEPEVEKWVRDCSFSRLGRLIKKIDKALLLPYDSFLPEYIHGGVTGEYRKHSEFKMKKCTQSAVLSLTDGKKGRALLRLDLKRFFEQVEQEEVVNLFVNKFKCSQKIARIISELCCVKEGKKGNLFEDNSKTLARGFASSGRLATWCKLGFFSELNGFVKKELKGHYPLLVIFVDDIGISAVNVTREQLEKLGTKIIDLAKEHDLVVHSMDSEKTEIRMSDEMKEHLGLRIARQKIFPSIATTQKRVRKINQMRTTSSLEQKAKIKRSLKGLVDNKNFTRRVSTS